MSAATVPTPTLAAASSHLARALAIPFALITFLTACALAIHGYHPYAEDGGLYAAGIKHLLDPALYPHSLPFVEAHLRYSLFAPAVAAIVRLTHLSLPMVLLTLHLASIWTTLLAVWLLAARCYTSRAARLGAVVLTAAWLTLPVAGTSLILMDPYLTARSIALPCTLLALAATLDLLRPDARLRAALLCGTALLLDALTHPLMAAFALGDVLLLTTLLAPSPAVRRWGTASLCFAALTVAALLQRTAPPDTASYTQVALTRYYWFLSQWQWYEWLGLFAPLAILAATTFQFASSRLRAESPERQSSARHALVRMALASGATALLIALLFAHESAATHLVARLQPLRAFQVVYLVMIMILGAAFGEKLLRHKPWRWAITLGLLGGIMCFVQRGTYPDSAHIEWPGTAPANEWQQAFLWISRNTPVDALFALDAHYIAAPGEDAQSFRASAERSALPDYSKDGGEAAITPALTAAWTVGQRAQAHLSEARDAERVAALRPLNVTWIVLQQHAQTGFDCPYRNPRVQVCRLP